MHKRKWRPISAKASESYQLAYICDTMWWLGLHTVYATRTQSLVPQSEAQGAIHNTVVPLIGSYELWNGT